MKKFSILLICCIVSLGCRNQTENTAQDQEQNNPEDQPINVQVALANGYEEFDLVQQINFTFNVRVNDTLRTTRAWKWFPKEDRVELTEKEETITYNNDGDFTEAEQLADRKFINDTYWLMFPFHLVWSDFNMEHNPSSEAPISKELMQQLTISFDNEGGYTPGDTYHIYFKDDKLIREWTYVSSGGRNLTTTWEDYKNFNGLNLAQMHKSEDGSFQLFFTDVEVIK